MKPLKESLISKDKRNWASKGNNDLYLVDPYNEYFETVKKLYRNKEIESKGSRIFILTSKDIKKVLKDTNHESRMDIRDLLTVYPLTEFKEHDIGLLKDDIKDEEYFENVVSSYGLTAVDPTKIK